MTREEVIVFLEAIKRGLHQTGKDSPYRDVLIPKMKEALCVAIKELKQEPYEDCVSRKTVRPKTGKWITEFKSDLRGDMWPVNLKCSICNKESYYYYKFCPYCGAGMVEPQNIKYVDVDSDTIDACNIRQKVRDNLLW